MTKYVIDASVVVKSLLNEDENVKTRFVDLLKKAQNKKIDLISSKLLIIEVSNGFRFGIKDVKECLDVFKDFLTIPITIVSLTNNQLRESIEMSYKLGTTVYDTSYHVLAKANSAIFLTCDKEYYKKAKSSGEIELLI
ncbi:MAG: type II toxin-antitoxin system VapC family toxin [bacterium]